MNLSKRDFGVTQGGVPVTAYTLANSRGGSAEFLDYGCTLRALTPSVDGIKPRNAVLGFDDIVCYEGDTCYLGGTIGRFSNRIAAGQFALNGTHYALAQNDGCNHLHGGIFGFHRQMWVATQENDALVMRRTSPDGEEGYPGNLKATVTIHWSDDNALTLEYDVLSDRDTPVSLTSHGYFNLGGNAMAHQLLIHAERYTEIDPSGMVNGNIVPVAGTPLDFRRFKPIGLEIDGKNQQLTAVGGYDHNFVLTSGAPAAHLCGGGLTMELTTDYPGLQFYSGNFLTDNYRGAVCLEPQFFPDSPNQPKFPSSIVRAGVPRHNMIRFSFSSGM